MYGIKEKSRRVVVKIDGETFYSAERIPPKMQKSILENLDDKKLYFEADLGDRRGVVILNQEQVKRAIIIFED